MLIYLFNLYLYFLAFVILATLLLILFGKSWGEIPHLYLNVVAKIQDQFQAAYPDNYFEQLPFKDIIDDRKLVLDCNEHRSTDFEIIDFHAEFPYSTNLNLARSGVEAILQDEFCGAFGFAPDHQRYELSRKLWHFIKDDLYLRVVFVLLIIFRIFFLFPIRLALYILSFILLTICCMVARVVDFTNSQKLFIARRYCRLYTAAIGLVAFYYNEEDKPQPPGIIVSNHLSANDIMVIFCDMQHAYSVTGQSHSGIIGFIQSLVSRLCHIMLLERSIAESRVKFLREVLSAAKQENLILMFPEGYCSNNTKVLQFRKAVFDSKIYPIAIKQEARFGDAYWREDWFVTYIFRLLHQFATVYHVHYLPAQHRMFDETNEEFAYRVQNLISKVSNCHPARFQANVFYRKSDQEKYKTYLKKICAVALIRSEAPILASSSDGP